MRIEDVQRAICEMSQTSKDDLLDTCRYRDLSFYRHLAMALSARLCTASTAAIARAFQRDERAVRYACERLAPAIAGIDLPPEADAAAWATEAMRRVAACAPHHPATYAARSCLARMEAAP